MRSVLNEGFVARQMPSGKQSWIAASQAAAVQLPLLHRRAKLSEVEQEHRKGR